MEERIFGGSCFLIASAMLVFFYIHYRRAKQGKEFLPEQKSKLVFFDFGILAAIRFFREKKIMPIKEERLERLRKVYVGKERDEMIELYYGSLLKRVVIAGIAGLFLVSAFSLFRPEQYLFEGYFLEREEAGGSEKSYAIRAEADRDKKEMTVAVPHRKYTEKEEKEILLQIAQKLEKTVLGRNQSADHIQTSLCFPQTISGYDASVHWEIPLDAPVAQDGSLKNQELKEPEQVVLKANIECGSSEKKWEQAVIIFPEEKKELSFWERWQEAYKEGEKESQTKKYVKLPDEVDGTPVRYSEKNISYVYIAFAVLLFLCIFLVFHAEGRLKAKIQKRQEQLMLDYPEFLEHFVLLVGAGLNIKGAWEKVVREYEKKGKKDEMHFVYEEMAVTVREIQNGMNEARAYELFGKRTELISYMKFCTLIVQNLKKGSADLLKLLEYEMTDSFHARKENAKVLGEKAGTKLLMPMAMMLLIVFALILYAAFQNM